MVNEKTLSKKSYKQLKAILDDTFQMYIRYRDGWACTTCGVVILGDKKAMHAGHYIDRGILSMRWNERSVNAQCAKCNAREHWSKDKNIYAVKLIEKYGSGILKELEHEKHYGKKDYKRHDFIDMILFYDQKTAEFILMEG